MKEELKSTWDDVKRLAQELEVKMHLAEMDAKDKWNNDLKPKVNQLEQQLAAAGKTVNDAVEKELSSIGAALRKLHAEIKK